ncbi:MAG: hypothetical protein IID38_07735 [Planctomycetes bacterium]|nr:hypothetical protein [Planctomycetota bacterium]
MATVNRLNIWSATGPAALYDLVAGPNGTENGADFEPDTAGRVQKEIGALPSTSQRARRTV